MDTEEVAVYLEDHSSNGTMYNGRRLSHQTVLLLDNDQIEIAGQCFFYSHRSDPGKSPFPPTQESYLAKAPEKIGRFILLRTLLGSGANAVVHLAFDTCSLKQLACKKLACQSPNDKRQIAREVQILRNLSHPNISRLEAIEEHRGKIYIFLQLVVGGDLFTYLSNREILIPSEAKFIFYQILLALNYLHNDADISHLDLKLENVILDGQGPYPKALLADFGHASFGSKLLTRLTGTVICCSPEMLCHESRSSGYLGHPADCWSLGIMLFYLIAGYHPFCCDVAGQRNLNRDHYEDVFGEGMPDMDQQDLDTCARAVAGAIAWPNIEFGSGNEALRALVRALLQKIPSQRATAKDALESDWIVSSESRLETLYRRTVLKLRD